MPFGKHHHIAPAYLLYFTYKHQHTMWYEIHAQTKTSAQGDHRHNYSLNVRNFLIISEWRVIYKDNDMIMKNTTACNRTKRLSRWYLTEIMFTFIPIIIPAQRKQGSVRAVHRLRFTHQITAISRCLVAVDMRILSNPSTDLNAINTHSYDRHASQTSDSRINDDNVWGG